MVAGEEYLISLSKEQLAKMPTMVYEGEIRVVDHQEKIAEALEYLRREPLVGFDTETKPSFKKGQTHNVALMQVSGTRRCYLFRINRTGLTDELLEWLGDENCRKVGLSLKDDFHGLHKLREFEPRGFVELQSLVKEYHIADSSLQKIYGIIFGQRISKGQRLSNWEADELGSGQQAYAALDAKACLDIYNSLRDGSFRPEESEYKITEQPEA